jgi:hypothetical protein
MKEMLFLQAATCISLQRVLLIQFRKAAIQKYSEAIELDQNPFLYSNRASALVKMGELDAALNDALKFVPSL